MLEDVRRLLAQHEDGPILTEEEASLLRALVAQPDRLAAFLRLEQPDGANDGGLTVGAIVATRVLLLVQERAQSAAAELRPRLWPSLRDAREATTTTSPALATSATTRTAGSSRRSSRLHSTGLGVDRESLLAAASRPATRAWLRDYSTELALLVDKSLLGDIIYTLEHEEIDARLQRQQNQTEAAEAAAAAAAASSGASATVPPPPPPVPLPLPPPPPKPAIVPATAPTRGGALKHFWAAVQGAGRAVGDVAPPIELRKLVASVTASVKSKWDDPNRINQAELYDRLEFVITSLNHFKRFSEPFLKPVSKTRYPDYPTYVRHPMDLSTMHSKLVAHDYRSKSDFAADLQLIFSNCILYNGSDPSLDIVQKMQATQKKAEKLMRQVPDLRIIDRSTLPGTQQQASHDDDALDVDAMLIEDGVARPLPSGPLERGTSGAMEVDEMPSPIPAAPLPIVHDPASATTAAPFATAPSSPSASLTLNSESSESLTAVFGEPSVDLAVNTAVYREVTRRQRYAIHAAHAEQAALPFGERPAIVRTPESLGQFYGQVARQLDLPPRVPVANSLAALLAFEGRSSLPPVDDPSGKPESQTATLLPSVALPYLGMSHPQHVTTAAVSPADLRPAPSHLMLENVALMERIRALRRLLVQRPEPSAISPDDDSPTVATAAAAATAPSAALSAAISSPPLVAPSRIASPAPVVATTVNSVTLPGTRAQSPVTNGSVGPAVGANRTVQSPGIMRAALVSTIGVLAAHAGFDAVGSTAAGTVAEVVEELFAKAAEAFKLYRETTDDSTIALKRTLRDLGVPRVQGLQEHWHDQVLELHRRLALLERELNYRLAPKADVDEPGDTDVGLLTGNFGSHVDLDVLGLSASHGRRATRFLDDLLLPQYGDSYAYRQKRIRLDEQADQAWTSGASASASASANATAAGMATANASTANASESLSTASSPRPNGGEENSAPQGQQAQPPLPTAATVTVKRESPPRATPAKRRVVE